MHLCDPPSASLQAGPRKPEAGTRGAAEAPAGGAWRRRGGRHRPPAALQRDRRRAGLHRWAGSRGGTRGGTHAARPCTAILQPWRLERDWVAGATCCMLGTRHLTRAACSKLCMHTLWCTHPCTSLLTTHPAPCPQPRRRPRLFALQAGQDQDGELEQGGSRAAGQPARHPRPPAAAAGGSQQGWAPGGGGGQVGGAGWGKATLRCAEAALAGGSRRNFSGRG